MARDNIGGANRSRRRGKAKISERHARISGLPKGVRDEIESRLISGDPPKEIARWVQDMKGLCTDVVLETLAGNIKSYAADLMTKGEDRARIKDLGFEELHGSVINMMTLPEEIDELAVMHRTIKVQSERVAMNLQVERTYQRPTKAGSRDIDLMSKLCVRSHDIKMDRGKDLPAADIGTLSTQDELRQRVNDRYGEAVGNVIANPESSAKVLSIFDNLKKRASLAEGDGK